MLTNRDIGLEIQFVAPLVEQHGSVRIGRAAIPLHLTERVNLRARTIAMREGWKLSVAKNNILIFDYQNLCVLIPTELIQRVVVS